MDRWQLKLAGCHKIYSFLKASLSIALFHYYVVNLNSTWTLEKLVVWSILVNWMLFLVSGYVETFSFHLDDFGFVYANLQSCNHQCLKILWFKLCQEPLQVKTSKPIFSQFFSWNFNSELNLFVLNAVWLCCGAKDFSSSINIP